MGEVEAAVVGVGDLDGGQAAAVAVGVGDRDDVQAAAGLVAMDGIQYCSEHPYRPGAAAAEALAGGGICAFCLQEKLGMLVSSSKSSPFFPPGGHPPPSASPPSFRRAAEPPLPPHSPARSRKFAPFGRKKASSSSSSSSSASATLSASMSGGGLRRSKSVAPRPEEQHFASFASSPRKKSFWSFLSLTSSTSSYAASTTSSASGGGAAARRKSVSVASAAWASRGGAAQEQDQQLRSAASGRRMEAIGEPESPSQSQVSSSSSFGRKVARSRSVGCGSRSFSGDFLERISFGDCTLRRVESQREPKANKMRAQGHLSGAAADEDDEDDDGDVYEHGQRIKCAGFFGGIGPTSSSSYWLSAAEGAAAGGCTRKPGSRSHRSWAWALASPMRALRPTSSTSTKIITAEPSSHSNGSTLAAALSVPSPMPSLVDAAAATTN